MAEQSNSRAGYASWCVSTIRRETLDPQPWFGITEFFGGGLDPKSGSKEKLPEKNRKKTPLSSVPPSGLESDFRVEIGADGV